MKRRWRQQQPAQGVISRRGEENPPGAASGMHSPLPPAHSRWAGRAKGQHRRGRLEVGMARGGRLLVDGTGQDTARAAIQAQGLCDLATEELAISPQRRPDADDQDGARM